MEHWQLGIVVIVLYFVVIYCLCTVGGLETETFKLCTGDPTSKDTALPTVSSDRVVSWAAYASWKAFYP